MKIYNKFNLILFSLFLCFFFVSKADAAVYIVHLSFDSQTNALQFGPDQTPVDLDKNETLSLNAFFGQLDTTKDADYLLKIQPSNGDELDVLKFNKQLGQFNLKIPFFVSGAQINIYDFHSGEKIASADISSFQTCDSNGICEYEKGENVDTCINDCATGQNTYSDQTKNLLEKNNGIVTDPKTGDVVLKEPAFYEKDQSSQPAPSSGKNIPLLIVTVIVTILVIFGAIFYYRKKIKND